MEKIEYRVRPVTRFVVTRYHDTATSAGGVETLGEYDNHEVAYQVGYALCKAEHDRLGYPPGDMRIMYPQTPAFGQIGGDRPDQFPHNTLNKGD
jgi:hypothetical protein